MREAAERGEQRHHAGIAEAQPRCGLAVLDGRQHDALKRRGLGRAGARRELGGKQALVGLMAELNERVPVVLGEQAAMPKSRVSLTVFRF